MHVFVDAFVKRGRPVSSTREQARLFEDQVRWFFYFRDESYGFGVRKDLHLLKGTMFESETTKSDNSIFSTLKQVDTPSSPFEFILFPKVSIKLK